MLIFFLLKEVQVFSFFLFFVFLSFSSLFFIVVVVKQVFFYLLAMEEEDQAVLSEVKIEIDVAEEPAEYWTTQQQVLGEWCTVSRQLYSI
jgi:hypothetical protein